ncbi:MAG: hypothetical protein H6Q21_1874 [Bacteroidetes bacterium]|nr:hypothetical protein [Bacteroidota bacterium]
MKTPVRFVCLFIILLATACEKDKIPDSQDRQEQGFDIVLDKDLYYSQEIFQDAYLGIYDKWRLDRIIGGYWGTGYEADFDQLVIEGFGIFKIYRNDSLLIYGKIEIKEQNDSILRISFIQGSSFCNMKFFDMDKYVRFMDSSMILSAPCCDRYSYCFTKCAVYSGSTYYQASPKLDNVRITRISIPAGKYLQSVFFTSTQNGYALCTDNTILVTRNGGFSWKECNTDADIQLYSLYFYDANTGFAVGGESDCSGTGCVPRGSIVLKTTNRGETWEKQTTPAKGKLVSIAFVDNLTGFAVGEGLLAKTNDGGTTWEEFTLELTGTIEKIFFLNHETGYMCGLFNNLFKTTDGGNTWNNLTPQNAKIIRHFNRIQFISENTGFLGTYSSGLLKTTDGGLSFTEFDYSPVGITGLFFTSEKDGIVFGKRNYSNGNCRVWESTLHITNDGGIDWQGDNKVSGSINELGSPEKNIYFGMQDREIIKIEVNRNLSY